MNITLLVNGRRRRVQAPPEKPLLWVLREDLQLTGTKYGCGVGVCRACTVLVDGQAAIACVLPVGELGMAAVVTIEGLSEAGDHPVQQAWIAEDTPQCGYCQPGMVMATAALLARTPHPSDTQIAEALPNICRCGTYDRIRRAVRRAAKASA